MKEVWVIDPALHQEGLVVHTLGWPLRNDTEGGGFLYHAADNQVYLGFIVALDYANPWLDPFAEFQRWKQHPRIRRFLQGGKRVSYGARAVNKGGLQSLPRLAFPGGVLAGCEAGFLNGAKIKGSHTAMKTGMLAAEAAFQAVKAGRSGDELEAYPKAFEESWLREELDRARNFKQWFKKGRSTATLMTGIEQWLLPKLGFKAPPWTLHRTAADHTYLKPAAECTPIAYPKPDGKLTFDRLSSVFISNTNHEENQPAHLTLRKADVPSTMFTAGVEWRPIETAPRDGTLIDVWCIRPPHEAEERDHEIRLTDISWCDTRWGRITDTGMLDLVEEGACDESGFPPWVPTHWRPLPAPPATIPAPRPVVAEVGGSIEAAEDPAHG